MSYPDVVKSSTNQSPQRPVNVLQRSQVSPAALIESEAGIKKGHVNNIASIFGSQQNPSVLRKASTNHSRQQNSNDTNLADAKAIPRAKLSRIAVVPREAGTQSSRAQPVSQSRPSNTGELSPKSTSTPRPAPWPKSTVSQLKPVRSFRKSDSDLYASSTEVRTSETSRAATSGQPTIVIKKAKYLPKTARTDAKPDLDTRRQSTELPSSVKVGRWTVYETLPFGSKQNKSTGNERNDRDALKKKEDDDWKQREAVERKRIAEAERRKDEYDRKHREELEAQERRRLQDLAAEEERRRKELEREKEERHQRAEEEKKRRRETEEQERRRLEEEREIARLENERRIREAREKRRLEQDREEADRRLRMERRRQEEQEELERRRREEDERRRAEERRRDDESRKKDKAKAVDSNPDLYTTEEWTVHESVPVQQAGLVASQSQPSFNSHGSSSSFGYRSLQRSGVNGAYGDSDANIESEYMRNLREIEEKRRQQEQEEMKQRDREAQRQRMTREEEEKRRQNEARRQQSDSQRLQEGVQEWSALANKEIYDSGSVVGYRRFLDDSPANKDDRANRARAHENPKNLLEEEDVRNRRDVEERRRRDAEEARERMRREAEERRWREDEEARARMRREAGERRRREESQERRRNEENRRRQELEAEQRQRESDYRRQREEDQRRREIERQRIRQYEEDKRRRESEQMQRDTEERMRRNANQWSKYTGENRFDPRESNYERLSCGQENSDIFVQDKWTVFESAPTQKTPVNGSPSQEDSIVGYRRLLEESNTRPLENRNDDQSRFSDRTTRTKVRITNDEETGRRRRTETSILSARRGRDQPESSPEIEDTQRFEEWTEYQSVPQSTKPGNSVSASHGLYDSHQRRSSSSSDDSRDAPKFEEWTVVHRVPSSQVNSAAGYDAVDTDAKKYGAETSDNDRDDRDDVRPSIGSWKQQTSHKRRFKSTDSLNLSDSNEDASIPVEEIMPRRRDSGRRQRDAMMAAALRQLESASSSGFADASEDVTDTPTARVSPYHSYQRIHHDHRGRYREDYAPATAAGGSNGNLFQDSFSVRRDNPAYRWQEA